MTDSADATRDAVRREDLLLDGHNGTRLHAWHYVPPAGLQTGAAIVMAHGIGGVKAAGLQHFAQRFAEAGHHILAFDYRHWGESDGHPRDWLSIRRQLQDYRTALRSARRLDHVDPDRVFAWGTSFAGMHVLRIAASEPSLAGAIAQVPLVDGLAATLNTSPRHLAALAPHVLRDRLRQFVGRGPAYLTLNGPVDSNAVIATSDAPYGLELLHTDTGLAPNRIAARSLLGISAHRPARAARRIRCPLLVVVADTDTMAPTKPALRAAAAAPRGEIVRSPGGHYDVYHGGISHATAITAELSFIARSLARQRDTLSHN